MSQPMSQPPYQQTWSVGPPQPPASGQWLAAGIAGIAGGFIVVTMVAGQVAFLLSGRGGLPAEQGFLIVAQLLFGIAVVVAAYLLAPGPLPLRLIGTAVFVGSVGLTTALATLRLAGVFRGTPVSIYLLNPNGLLLLAGAAGWLIAARAQPVAYLALVPTIAVLVLPGLLLRMNLPNVLVTAATLGGSLVIALLVLLVSKPRTA